MARQKVTHEPLFANWDDVNRALKAIGLLDRKIAEVQQDLNARIDELKAAAARKTTKWLSDRKRLAAEMQDFTISHQVEMEKTEGKRSKTLLFGRISFRRSTVLKTLKGWTWDRVLTHLKEIRRRSFIRVREDVNKEAIKLAHSAQKLADDELAGLGLVMQQKDTFGFEVDQEKLDQETAA